MSARTRAYKFRIYPSKEQEKLLLHHLHISKDTWNFLLSANKEKYQNEGKFLSKSEMQTMVKESGLYSQAAQAVSHRLHDAIKRKIIAKNQGKNVGFPRFKSIDRMKSLHYPQFGFSLGEKLEATPFGKIGIVKHRQLEGRVKTLTLKRESSGRWFAIFSAETEAPLPKQNTGPKVGLDLGLTNFAALSDGTMLKNPHHFRAWEKRLAASQRRLSSKKKGGKNRAKAKLKLALLHEKVADCRNDFLHKTANRLLSSYSFIALENLRIQEMAGKRFGKWINDASWAKFTGILGYKAEEAGCQVVFVDAENTTKECSACGNVVEKPLWQRTHRCPSCGLMMDRDLNASINILNKALQREAVAKFASRAGEATAGIAGSNACGEGQKPSLKQEAHTFRCGCFTGIKPALY